MVKLSEGKSTSSGGSSTVHVLTRKAHLCLLPGSWFLERVCVNTKKLLHQPAPCCHYHGDPVLTPAPCPHGPGPPASPGEEEPGAGALPQLWGRPMAVNPEDVVGEAGESSRPQPWEQ